MEAECLLSEIKEYSGDDIDELTKRQKKIKNKYDEIKEESKNLPSDISNQYEE